MWSGWGIRTLSSLNPAYNPFSYQNGSIWPHDNGIIAAGLKRYGLIDEANQVIRGIFDAARRFDAYRLPEVYAGLQREGKHTDFPALYPGGANIPQAWASGSIFQMLQAILGLRADAPHHTLYVCPMLPSWLPEIEMNHLRVGHCTLKIRFWRDGESSKWSLNAISLDKEASKKELIQVLDEPTMSVP
jgi:glycogen debranching enzyme